MNVLFKVLYKAAIFNGIFILPMDDIISLEENIQLTSETRVSALSSH